MSEEQPEHPDNRARNISMAAAALAIVGAVVISDDENDPQRQRMRQGDEDARKAFKPRKTGAELRREMLGSGSGTPSADGAREGVIAVADQRMIRYQFSEPFSVAPSCDFDPEVRATVNASGFTLTRLNGIAAVAFKCSSSAVTDAGVNVPPLDSLGLAR